MEMPGCGKVAHDWPAVFSEGRAALSCGVKFSWQ